MSKPKTYTKDDIFDFGTKVKVIEGSQWAHWNKYPISVVSFRWRPNGGIDYRVRAWRTNQHWIPAEELEKVADAAFCSNCLRLMNTPCCGGHCHGHEC